MIIKFLLQSQPEFSSEYFYINVCTIFSPISTLISRKNPLLTLYLRHPCEILLDTYIEGELFICGYRQSVAHSH